MEKLIETFDVLGSDGEFYEVHHLERQVSMRTMSGSIRYGRGSRRYLLADGRTLIDIDNKEWEILNTDIRLPKPEGA